MHSYKKKGQLSKADIQRENNLQQNFHIWSYEPNSVHTQFSSVDVTPTIIAMSSKIGMLEIVYKTKSQYENGYYIYVKPKDTVLIVSNEHIRLSNDISGYVTSRVSSVTQGFGHISTTIDPNWNGALLIALNNPTNHTLKVNVGFTTCIDVNGNIKSVFTNKSLATITFHYLCTKVETGKSPYVSMRTDLLKKTKYDTKKGVKAFLRKHIHYNRRRFTDYFFEYMQINEDNLGKDEETWKNFLNEFSIVNSLNNQTTKKQIGKCAYDFVIRETWLNRTKLYLMNHKSSVIAITSVVVYLLFRLNIIPEEIIDQLINILGLV